MEPINLSQNFDAAQKAISAALVATTKTASHISAEDIDFYRSSDPPLRRAIDDRSARLLALSERLLHRATLSKDVSRPRLRSIDTVESNWRTVVDGVDALLERADIALDELAGYFRKRNDDSREHSPAPKRSKTLPREFRNQNIVKPQLLFTHQPFNNETEPFQPFLSSKPHARTSLQESMKRIPGDGYFHPYQSEIEAYQYPASVHTQAPPIEPTQFESTHATLVDDIQGVHAMLAELKQAQEIAIDLEHHDAHSYIGMVSLMQISTRDQDWIVDTLKPWRRDLQILNEVFADPSIVKVFHGAQMDAIWLQRDLGLYIVGLFDTYHASRSLGYVGHGLAFLLKKFVDFDAQKQYQTADWRIRPLPTELFNYARSDTHFLLYIYDNMRNELIQKSTATNDKLQDVLQNSKDYALQRYEHPFYCTLPRRSANGWFNMLQKTPNSLTNNQLAVFRKVHQWRDNIGREEDESPNYIMANYVLQNISRTPPSDRATLLALAGNITPVVRSRIDELLSVIADAQSHPTIGAETRHALEEAQSTWTQSSLSASHPATTSTIPSTPANEEVAEAARAMTSQFWGSAWENGNFTMMQLPELFELTFNRLTASAPSEDTASHGQVRHLTRKRKHRDTDGATDNLGIDKSMTADSISDNMAKTDEVLLQIQRKAAKKATKKLDKNHTITDANGDTSPSVISNSNDARPFNYASAPSVLQDNGKHNIRRDKGRKESFNPYAKAAEAPSGLGRAQNFRTGRTATFKGEGP